jgi:hypothetical protein
VETQRSAGRAVAHGKKLVLTKHCKINDHCATPDAAVVMTIEIKERNLKFTCPKDFPFDTVFVDDLRGLGKESVRPFAYVFLSKITGEWVWVSPLDQDETWSETVVRDTTRGHEMGMLVCPRAHLRPAQQLIDYLLPHQFLELIDGDTECFVRGGGEAEERERYVAKTNPNAGGRDRKTAPQAGKHMG